MIDRPSTVLIVGATGSIGRHAVAEALQQGYTVRALVRDPDRAARLLPESVELVIGDLTRPETVSPAVDGVDAIVFTHGSTTSERDVRDNDYTGVANVLKALGGRRTRIALMTAIGTTRPGVAYAQWKLRSERLIRASGNLLMQPKTLSTSLSPLSPKCSATTSPQSQQEASKPGTKSGLLLLSLRCSKESGHRSQFSGGGWICSLPGASDRSGFVRVCGQGVQFVRAKVLQA